MIVADSEIFLGPHHVADPDLRLGGKFYVSLYVILIFSLEGSTSIAKLDGATWSDFPSGSAPVCDEMRQ